MRLTMEIHAQSFTVYLCVPVPAWLILCFQFKTIPASRFICIFCTEHELFFIRYDAVRKACNVTTAYTDGMKFCNIFSPCHQEWHLPKRFALEIHIKACNDHPCSPKGKFITYTGDLIIKKLGFIQTDHINI